MADEQVDKIGDRRRRVIRSLVKIARDSDGGLPPFEKGRLLAYLAGLSSTTAPTVDRDLLAIEAGELPAAPRVAEEVSAKQLDIARAIREAKDDDGKIDNVMIELAAGILERTVDSADAKGAQAILMGRRYFIVAMRSANGKGGGSQLVAVAGVPIQTGAPASAEAG